MVRNQTFTSSVSAAVSAELTESLQQTLAAPNLRRLEDAVVLPNTWRGFALLVLAVMVISAGMALHVMLAITSFQARQQIAQLEQQMQIIEQRNAELVWQIAQHTALTQVRSRALALGYDVPQERHYVIEAPQVMNENRPKPTVTTVTTVAPSFGDRLQTLWQTLQRWW
jgi:hypothetical protein